MGSSPIPVSPGRSWPCPEGGRNERSPASAKAEPLGGGVANRGRVFRCGATVRRPRAPFGQATYAVLAHLDSVGFTGSPRVLAVEAETEVLSWIPGRAASDPLPEWALSEQTLISIATLIRRFHQAMESFDGTGYSWARPVPVSFRGRLVSHNDLHPGNIIFDGTTAVGLVDFDLAGPGSVIWDVATVARCWCPLLDDRDVPPAIADRRFQRLAVFLDACGLTAADRIAAAEALLPNHDWTYRIVADAVRSGHPAFRDYWREVARRTDRARDWMLRHRGELLTAAS